MALLTGGASPVDLGSGYSILAPGVRGQAERRRPRTADERTRSRTVADGTEDLDAALTATGISEVQQIEITVQPRPPRAAGALLRTTDGRQEAVELRVPDLGPETGQLVLACDEMGVLTWHLPVDAAGAVETPATRGHGHTKKFRIPATRVAPPQGDGRTRSLMGVLGRKLLKVLVYPITDPLIGSISRHFAERWEERKRPYALRAFTPSTFRDAAQVHLSDADWTRMAQGPALMFVHGTFSTAHSAFSLIPDDVFAELHARYDGRVFAFDHFTLSHDPVENVRWLDERLPALDLDLVCHSRGGLVARTFAERPAALGLKASRSRVGRVVFVGVPNAGTLLADPAHLVAMIDRLTTALNLFPSGPVGEVLEGLLTAIKVIGHGALSGLSGLASMRPGGTFLSQLNTGSDPSRAMYYAIGADYEPVEPGLKALVAGTVANAVVDRVFEDMANDLVVPEAGVFEVEGSRSFPIALERRLRVPPEAGVIHTTLFGHDEAAKRLLDWLRAR